MEYIPIHDPENDEYYNYKVFQRIESIKKSRRRDFENNCEDAEAATAAGFLDLILEYPAELENFTYNELLNFYKTSFDGSRNKPDQDILNFLVENNILLYKESVTSENSRYYLNHSNYFVASRAMENDERGLDNNANFRVIDLVGK